MIKKHFPVDRTVNILELGCGSGILVGALIRSGYSNVRGIDVSPEQVQLARSRGLSSVEQRDLIVELPSLATASLDVVVAFDVLEHIPADHLFTVVSEMHRVLKAGGKLV